MTMGEDGADDSGSSNDSSCRESSVDGKTSSHQSSAPKIQRAVRTLGGDEIVSFEDGLSLGEVSELVVDKDETLRSMPYRFVRSTVRGGEMATDAGAERLHPVRDAAVTINSDLVLVRMTIDDDYEKALRNVKNDERYVRFVRESIFGHWCSDIALEAVRQSAQAFWYMPDALRSEYSHVLDAVSRNGLALRYASETFRSDFLVVSTAVRQNGLAIRFAHPDLRRVVCIFILAVRQNIVALQYVDEHLRKDIAHFLRNRLSLEHAPDYYMEDELFVSFVVSRDGLQLRFAGDPHVDNFDIVILAVRSNPLAIQYASEELRDDHRIALEAVARNGLALRHVSRRLQGDYNTVLEAVQQNGLAIQYASEGLRGDEAIVREAVRQNPEALEHASERIREALDSIGL